MSEVSDVVQCGELEEQYVGSDVAQWRAVYRGCRGKGTVRLLDRLRGLFCQMQVQTVGDLFPDSSDKDEMITNLTVAEQDGQNSLSVQYVKNPNTGFVTHFPAGMIMVGREREL
jgi:hypothetical protein